MADLSIRYSGILMHPTCLPSRYGIGDFGYDAYDFINFLKASGQTLWQILPLGPTGFGDSPYQAFSAFAGQPLLISPDKLRDMGLLPQEAIDRLPWFNVDMVEYGFVIPIKNDLYRQAFEVFESSDRWDLKEDFARFMTENADWLDDYALFMAGKDYHDGKSWLDWDSELRDPDEVIKARWREKLSWSVHYYSFLQYIFFRQWNDLRNYAHSNGIQIVGDIPIFVSLDSADVWANRNLFQLDSHGYPQIVAGVPPDYFSATGQLWGNPLYDWNQHKATGYDWWTRRVAAQLKMVDYLRIDHFRGFDSYYAIPHGDTTAINGYWCPGPGHDLFRTLKANLGENLPIWAEDLGSITDDVEALRDGEGFPGMKVLQFAFSNLNNNELLPHQFTSDHFICYTGTHDNNTTLGWYFESDHAVQDRVRRYMNTDGSSIHMDFIRTAMSSVAKYCIFPIQDALGFGSDCRMNKPGVGIGNWSFRIHREHMNPGLAKHLRSLSSMYGRIPEENLCLNERIRAEMLAEKERNATKTLEVITP